MPAIESTMDASAFSTKRVDGRRVALNCFRDGSMFARETRCGKFKIRRELRLHDVGRKPLIL
jgi:hypothetical protein